MEIFNHSLCTKSLGAPADMPEPDCSALPVVEQITEFGTWSVSFWKPSADEIMVLSEGGTIALWVRAQDDNHPVVGVGVQPVDAKVDTNQ
jgi:hypothetical protein